MSTSSRHCEAYLWSSKSLLRPSFANLRFRWPLPRDILRVGLIGAVSTAATNLAIGIATALEGGFGTAPIAGYGTTSRLEYLPIPLLFGLGGPLVPIVSTCIGAGVHERALRATWIGAGIAVAMTEAIGLWAASFPHAWLSLLTTDAAILEADTLGAWLTLRRDDGLTQVFVAQGVALVIYGLVNAMTMMGGAWSGSVAWPRSTAVILRRVQET